MEIGTFQMGEVGEKSFCNKYGSSIFGSKWHFNTPYHVNVEKYKAALESLKNKTYIKFEDGVQSVVFSFEVWRGSYSDDYYYTFYAFPGTKGVKSHYDCIQREYDEAPSDEEYLKIIQPILDSITGVAEDDWNDAITDLWKQQKEIEKKIEILKSNYELKR